MLNFVASFRLATTPEESLKTCAFVSAVCRPSGLLSILSLIPLSVARTVPTVVFHQVVHGHLTIGVCCACGSDDFHTVEDTVHEGPAPAHIAVSFAVANATSYAEIASIYIYLLGSLSFGP